MGKSFSLLKFQLKVLSAYFKNPRWDLPKLVEFLTYLLYYTLNFCYYLLITSFEGLWLRKYPQLNKADKRLAELYRDNNQFWISLIESYKQKKEKIVNLTYGETSYFAINESLYHVDLNKDDTFYDLGCGIGKTVFLANALYGAKSIGVDIIHDFIENANIVINEMKLENISFIEKSIFDLDLKKGTVFYITPTCFDPENMQRLLKKFESLPKGSRLIVLSKKISLPNLELTGSKKLFYSWGKAETFYYKVI